MEMEKHKYVELRTNLKSIWLMTHLGDSTRNLIIEGDTLWNTIFYIIQKYYGI